VDGSCDGQKGWLPVQHKRIEAIKMVRPWLKDSTGKRKKFGGPKNFWLALKQENREPMDALMA
jgi:hypothetical protein